MISNSLLHQITLGREGKNWGFSMGIPKLESVVDGVTQGIYTLVFSPTSSSPLVSSIMWAVRIMRSK